MKKLTIHELINIRGAFAKKEIPPITTEFLNIATSDFKEVMDLCFRCTGRPILCVASNDVYGDWRKQHV